MQQHTVVLPSISKVARFFFIRRSLRRAGQCEKVNDLINFNLFWALCERKNTTETLDKHDLSLLSAMYKKKSIRVIA